MGRTVEINIPMFIGIILLIAAITAMLVFGTNKARDLMNEKKFSNVRDDIDAFIMYVNEDEKKNAIYLANELRMSGFVVETEYTNRSLKSQFKRADYFDSKYLILLNSDDLNEGLITIKNNKTKEEEKIMMEYAIYYFDEHISDDNLPIDIDFHNHNEGCDKDE